MLVLIVFEAHSSDPHFIAIETFLLYEAFLMVFDLLLYLLRHTTNDDDEDYEQANHTSFCEFFGTLFALALYLTQTGWIVYGNYLYFNFPTELIRENEQSLHGLNEVDKQDFMHKRWLFSALMCVLMIGYIHLMIFFAFCCSTIIYIIVKCTSSDRDLLEAVDNLKPTRVFKLIDDGFFAVMDDLENEDEL